MRRLIRSKEPGPTVSAGGKSSAPAGAETPQRLRCLPAKRASAASAAVLPQGAALCGDRGGLIKRGPRKTCFAGKSSTFHRRKVDRKAAGGPLYQGRNAPRNPPFACTEDIFCCTPIPCPPSKKKRVYGRNMVSFPDANCAGGPVSLDRLGRRTQRLPAALRRSRGAGQIARGPLCGAAMAFPQKRPRSNGEVANECEPEGL